MQTMKRLVWLFLLLGAAAFAISSVQCLNSEDKSESDDFFSEELDNFDYEGEEGEYETTPLIKQEYSSVPSPPSPPTYKPTETYTAPTPSTYQVPAYQAPSYAPAYQAPNYTTTTTTSSYVEPLQVNYQAPPVYQQQTYTPIVYTAQPNYTAPSYTPLPTYAPVVYPSAPQVNYTAQPVYTASPPPTYAPVSYSAPQPNYTAPSYVPPPPPPTYAPVAYSAPQPNYTAPSYVPPPPTYAPVVYSAQPQVNYTAPATYNTPPPPTYAPVTYSQPINYTAPSYTPPPPSPTYAPIAYSAPTQTNYTSHQSYAPQSQTTTYNNKPYQQHYQAPPVVYHHQQPPALKYITNHSAPLVPYTYKAPAYTPAALAQKYSLADLAPYTTPFGYRANHWSLHYYRFNSYRTQCPKQMYTQGPAYKDIEQAFAYALTQLGQLKSGVSYMNASQPTFAARHQIFSYLSQQQHNARMDEEGLLVELVSQYLADRLCLTKWDRQRYLPQLTKLISASSFPTTHTCSQYHQQQKSWQTTQKTCYANKYRTIDGFCNNPYHPYWGKANVCHIRLLSPDYADGVSLPRESHNPRYPLPNPRHIANTIHNDVPIDGPYNLMKMQWGQFINHDISNTALSAYEGLVDCCKHPQTRGCWPIYVPHGDRFYGPLNVTCLNFIRSGVCPTCQLGPRQQTNKNTAFLDLSHVYGNSQEQANSLRLFQGGQLRTSPGKNGEALMPISNKQDQCFGTCYEGGDSRANQHPALTALHVLLLRNHNRHAHALSHRHRDWSDEQLYQEARRLNIAEYQMITFNEYLPIVFGPILSAYYHIHTKQFGYTQYDPKVDPTSWNEYTTAACRFGHSQISSTFGLYSRILHYGHQEASKQPTYRLKDWFLRPSLMADGQLVPIVNGLLARPAQAVDPWVTTDVRNHLYQSHREHSGGDLSATNIWRGRDHGLPAYVHYLDYCFNYKVRGWKDLQLFIPHYTLNQLRKLYKVVENVDLFTGGLAERHFPGADIGPTFACVNGIQYYHLKFGDRYYFEHGSQAGSFTPIQLDEIRRTTLARLLCRTAYLPQAPQYAFLAASQYNPLVNCTQVGDIDYNKF